MNNKTKKKLVIVGRLFTQAVHNLLRNVWLTTAALAVMVVTLALLLVSSIINMTLAETIDDRTDDFSVAIYFNDDPDPTLLSDMRSELEAKDYVESVSYVSKEEARQEFESRGDDFISEGLDLSEENILPASYDIRFNDLTKTDEVIELAATEKYKPIVYRTSDNELRSQSISQYLTIQNSVNRAMLIAAAIFGAIAILIVFNTIRMAVFSRSREIEIMKLIGATPSYIRAPFLFEAMLYGLLAGAVAFSIAYSLLRSFLPNISSLQAEQTVDYYTSNWWLVLLITLGVGALIGLVSSYLATAKYLRLKRW